jgi:uncharacterized protein
MGAVTAAAPAIVGFARALRAAGVAAGPERVHAWVDALGHLDGGRSADVYWSGRLTLCSCPDDLPVYDATFAAYFGSSPLSMVRRTTRPVVEVLVPVPVEDGDQPTGELDERNVYAATASRVEVLRHRDLAALGPGERAEVNRLLAAIRPTGPTRLTRRWSPSHRGPLDPRRTVRDMMRRGGEPAHLLRRSRRLVPRRLVLLLDVSGSMSAYSDGLLRFAHVACRRRPATEVFTMGTRLTRVSRELRQPDPDRALQAATAAVPDWSGGTRLGDQVKAFLDRWGQRGIARGAVVVVASDGWERGDVTLLAEQMERMRRLAHRVVWVSPHAGKDGFTPATAGLRAAAPAVDALMAGHNVAALAKLAGLLSEEEIRA